MNTQPKPAGEWTEGMVFAYWESEDWQGLTDAHNAALAAVAPKLRQNLRDVCAERDKAQQQLAAEREKVADVERRLEQRRDECQILQDSNTRLLDRLEDALLASENFKSELNKNE